MTGFLIHFVLVCSGVKWTATTKCVYSRSEAIHRMYSTPMPPGCRRGKEWEIADCELSGREGEE